MDMRCCIINLTLRDSITGPFTSNLSNLTHRMSYMYSINTGVDSILTGFQMFYFQMNLMHVRCDVNSFAPVHLCLQNEH
jgi:hypothetical protein